MSSQNPIEYELQVSYNGKDWQRLDFIFKNISSSDLQKDMQQRKNQHRATTSKVIHYRFVSFDPANRANTEQVLWQV